MKKLLSIAAACAFAIIMLAGCSGTSTQNLSNEQQQSATGTETEKTNSAASGEKVKLEFFVQQSMYYEYFQKAVDSFNGKNPDIVIEANNAPEPEKVLQTRVMSDNVPDIVSTWSSAADFKTYAKSGYFMDLIGQEFLSTVNQDFLASIRVDGKDYSLPNYYCAVGLYYNKKLFAGNGLLPPKTYAQLIDDCKALKSKNIMPFTFSDKEDWSHGKLNMPLYVNYIDNSQQFFNDLAEGKTTADTNPSYRNFAKMILELRQYAPADTLSIDYNTALGQFANGEAAMAIEGSWYAAQIKSTNPDCNFEMIPFPAADEGKAVVPITVDASLAISAKVKNKDAALKLLSFFTEKDIAQMISDGASSPCLISGVEFKNNALAAIIDSYKNGKVAPWSQDLWPAPVVPENYKLVQNLVSSKDVDAFIKGTDKMFKDANKH